MCLICIELGLLLNVYNIPMTLYQYFKLPLFSKAQIAFLQKELCKEEMSKHEADVLSVFATQVQQQLQQQEETVQQQQLRKKELWQLKEKEEQDGEQMEQQQCKEHQQPQFDGEAYFIQDQEEKG